MARDMAREAKKRIELHIRIDEEFQKMLKAKAKKRRLTVSAFVKKLVKEA